MGGSKRFGKYVFFWDFRVKWHFGLEGPTPFMPYEWRLYAGPFCLCRITDRKARRLSRQERRKLERDLRKVQTRLLGEGWK